VVPAGRSGLPRQNIEIFKSLLSFHDYYWSVHLLDIEWLLSTLFDASLFRLRAARMAALFFAERSADGELRRSLRPFSPPFFACDDVRSPFVRIRYTAATMS
jgi:hypothetical protein